jgi:Mn2+/Fe2+ NRAMP family transporter
MPEPVRTSWYRVVAPGILLAATGVGAGDLLTSTLAGSEAGLSVLWCVAVGALLKWALAEGLTRWQLATGSTLLEGWTWKLGGWVRWVFLAYLLLFTVIVGRALASACGVAATGFFQVGEPSQSVVFWGVAHSLAGMALALFGGFALFEGLMSGLIGLMFVTVLFTAVAIGPDWAAVARGFVPSIPERGSHWVLAVLGGVGGTVTLLSYGYWIREQGRRGLEMLPTCRLDLAVGNGMTGLFGVAVILIGSRLELDGGGSMLALAMADQLAAVVGPAGRWIFLLGFWGAVFSSLLGVWQSIPYLIADFFELHSGAKPGVRRDIDLRKTPAYRSYVVVIGVVPLFFLGASVRSIQLVYGVFGALFLPLLALTLLVMNNKRRWVGSDSLSPVWIKQLLAAAMALFAYLGWTELVGK